MSDQAKEIEAGLKAMGPFLASKCRVCRGDGRYEQTYTAGCGMGHYTAMGECDWCDGTGMRVGDRPASASVINQVREAGRTALAAAPKEPNNVP